MIDRRVRELQVESEMMPLSTPATVIKEKGFKAIIISGGPKSVNDLDAPKYDPEIFKLGLPILGEVLIKFQNKHRKLKSSVILGICYGLQLINKEFGGTVKRTDIREDGEHTIKIVASCPLFK